MQENSKNWTSEEIEDICKRYAAGETYSEIGKTYGKNSEAIRSVVRRHSERVLGNNKEESPVRATAECISDVNTEVRHRSFLLRERLSRPRSKEPNRLYTRIAYRGRMFRSR